MFLKKNEMKEDERGKEGRKGGKKKRKIKLTTTDSEWPYMKTSVKQSDLALSLLGDNNSPTIHWVLPCYRHCAK